MKYKEFDNIESSVIVKCINEFVHDEKHRAILISRFVDGLSHGDLAEKYNYSERNIKKIVYKNGDNLLKKMRQLKFL